MILSWARQLEAIDEACRAAAKTLAELGTEQSRAAADSIVKKLDAMQEDGGPVIALVGQYDAGKSTLIKALTGEDVAISADIETDRAAPFRWKGLVLVDTPGVKAGRPDHDIETERWLAKSDLILFLVTNELFDDVGGMYFRKLAYDQNRADLMMLVVNKISRERGAAQALEHMRHSLMRVVSPRTPEDFRWVAIDAKSYLDASEDGPDEERHELRERSRLEALGVQLERFGEEKRVLARALSPLSLVIHHLEQARDETAAGEDRDRRDYLELLRRRALLLRNTRSRVELVGGTTIGRHAAEVRKPAQEILRLLTPDDITAPPSKDDLDEALGNARSALDSQAEKLSKELQAGLSKEILRLNEELRALSEGTLARSLAERVLQFKAPVIAFDLAAPGGMPKTDEALRGQIKGGLSGLGKAFLAAEKTEMVKVARFFGVKFRPWGAGKALARLQGLGKVLGAAGPVLDIVFHVLDERRRDVAEKELAGARKNIREEFANASDEFRTSSHESLGKVLDDVFTAPLEEVESERGRLRADKDQREASTSTISGHLEKARKIWQQAVRFGGVSEE